MVFNPIIEFLQSKNDCGFNLNEEKIITLPYADDFCLITTDLRKHQKIQNEIKSKIESMGMRLTLFLLGGFIYITQKVLV